MEREKELSDATSPTLLASANQNFGENFTVGSLETKANECSVCLETFHNPYILPCGHSFHLRCIKGLKKNLCPLDRIPFEENRMVRNIDLGNVLQESLPLAEIYELFCIDTRQ
jgi:hypothetical protein